MSYLCAHGPRFGLPYWAHVQGTSLRCYETSEVLELFQSDMADIELYVPLPLVMNWTCTPSVCILPLAKCDATFMCKVRDPAIKVIFSNG